MERASESRSRAGFLDRRGELAVALGLCVLAILLMTFTDSTQAQIARHVEDFLLSPFRAVDRSYRHVRSVFTSNQALKLELARAELELVRTAELRLENARLRAMLGFQARETIDLIGCEVLAEGAGRLGGTTVLLNRGYNQGIRVEMPLAGREGLAGKVVEVRPERSHAYLLNHPDCAVAARVERSRVAGIVEWSPGSLGVLKLRHVSYLADVKVGDRIVSSGLGGVFPEGITVGTVAAVKPDETGLVLDINLKPAVDFSALEEVFALQEIVAPSPSAAAPVGAPPGPLTPPAPRPAGPRVEPGGLVGAR
jgi:rod shape-determining protein MreC